MSQHKAIFQYIYDNGIWGKAEPGCGTSGAGSALEHNRDVYIPVVRAFINARNVKTIVDIGCGDFQFGDELYEGMDEIRYTGYDVCGSVVRQNTLKRNSPSRRFLEVDAYAERNSLEPADLCILKDVLQHWSLGEIYAFLDFLVESRKYRYILICNCCHQIENDTDIHTGGWRPLSARYFPLKRYSPSVLCCFKTKEISYIGVSREQFPAS